MKMRHERCSPCKTPKVESMVEGAPIADQGLPKPVPLGGPPLPVKWILLGALGGCVLLGLAFRFFWPGPLGLSGLLFHLGVAGLVGQFTNMLAIRMIFGYVYLPLGFTRLKLPGSGLVLSNLDAIVDHIGQGFAAEVFTPQAVVGELEQQGVVAQVGELLSQRLQDQGLLRQLANLVSRPLLRWVRSEGFYSLVRERIAEYVRRNFLVRLARLARIIDYDELTCQLVDELEKQVRAFKEEGGGKLQEGLRLFLEEAVRDEPQIDRALSGVVSSLLQGFDFGEVVRKSLGERPPEEVQGFFVGLGGRYLDWIEVFGGAIGAGVGVATWAVSLLR